MLYLDMFIAVGIAFSSMDSTVSAAAEGKIKTIDETNWRDMLNGEWLVKFYAPWCPACKAMSPAWQTLAEWCQEDVDKGFRGIGIADVDVTLNPGLTGRFMVTSLPTIFHIKDGTFRIYSGSRDETELFDFLNEDKFLQLPPLSWYLVPNSLPMECLSLFFKMAVIVRDIHSAITTTYNLPVWVSYVLFTVTVIISGFVLALLLILVCDKVLASRASHQPVPASTTQHSLPADEGPDDVSDVVEDDLSPTSVGRDDETLMSGGDYVRSGSARQRRH